MTSIGTGYDLYTSQFSPDGRVFQIDYAGKAVDISGTAVALRGKDGVVFAVEKIVSSKLYVSDANKRIFNADRHIGIAVSGLVR
jgi:20S proteasome subunit alpha 7